MFRKKTPRLEEALVRHRDAVAAFVVSATATESDGWSHPVAPGKWSPSQIAEHLRLALVAVTGEWERGSGMRLLLPAWKRYLLRRTVLPRLLATGRFPAGVRAPREIRPALPAASKEEALRGLESAAMELESRCRWDPRAQTRRLTHPYFGALPAADLILILAWHTLHHRAQLPTGSAPPQ